jgi:hypothetical protein
VETARRPIDETKARFLRRVGLGGLSGDGVQLAQTARDSVSHTQIVAGNGRRRPQCAMNRFEATNNMFHGGLHPDLGHGRKHGRCKLISTQPERDNSKISLEMRVPNRARAIAGVQFGGKRLGESSGDGLMARGRRLRGRYDRRSGRGRDISCLRGVSALLLVLQRRDLDFGGDGRQRGNGSRALQYNADFVDGGVERLQSPVFGGLQQPLAHVFAQSAHRIQNVVGHKVDLPSKLILIFAAMTGAKLEAREEMAKPGGR